MVGADKVITARRGARDGGIAHKNRQVREWDRRVGIRKDVNVNLDSVVLDEKRARPQNIRLRYEISERVMNVAGRVVIGRGVPFGGASGNDESARRDHIRFEPAEV